MVGTLAQTTQPVTWPIAVPWVLTFVFGLSTAIFAYLNYRRTRFGAVKIVRSEVQSEQSARFVKKPRKDTLLDLDVRLAVDVFWRIDLLSYGADLYELTAFLEVTEEAGKTRRMPFETFEEFGEVPNPLKNGQMASLRLSHRMLDIDDTHIERHHDLPPRPKLYMLPPSMVNLCIYGNGDRLLVKRVSGKRLRPLLEQFEKDHSSDFTDTG